jgi:hypothetical protein
MRVFVECGCVHAFTLSPLQLHRHVQPGRGGLSAALSCNGGHAALHQDRQVPSASFAMISFPFFQLRSTGRCHSEDGEHWLWRRISILLHVCSSLNFIMMSFLRVLFFHDFTRLSKSVVRFREVLDVIKFICKEMWTSMYGKQIDNLRTNKTVRRVRTPFVSKYLRSLCCALFDIRCLSQSKHVDLTFPRHIRPCLCCKTTTSTVSRAFRRVQPHQNSSSRFWFSH